MKQDKTYNKHHRIYKECWWSNEKDNIKTMEVYKHDAVHAIFPWKTPAMQLLEVLKLNFPVRNKNLEQDLFELLENYSWNYYNQHCLDGSKYNKNKEIWALLEYRDSFYS